MALLDRHREEDEATELIVETLLDARALPQTDEQPNQASLLHLTVRSYLNEHESTSILHMLCEAGAAVDHQDQHGYTPLQTAAYYGHVDMTQSLLLCAADVNVRAPLLPRTKVTTYEGQRQQWYGQDTSLHFASGRGHVQVVALLLDFKADVGILDARGRSWIDVSKGPVHSFASACSESFLLALTK
eukprot:Skav231799  [mRNA]  locus=scaffold6451:1638:2198:+ [translate_table: standard]